MSHEIIIIEKGTGETGTAESQVKYTPSHDEPDRVSFKKMQHAKRVLADLNDYLYGAASSSSTLVND